MENQKKYGLTKEYIDYLKLPHKSNVKVYSVEKLMNARKKLTTVEKIDHLLEIKEALEKKLSVITSGRTINDFTYLTPQEFEKVRLKGLQPQSEDKTVEGFHKHLAAETSSLKTFEGVLASTSDISENMEDE
jgi:hypothetical protein